MCIRDRRGEPALFDKWTRTNMALRGGADMVLELPAHSVLSSSRDFARGAIAVLNGLQCIDTLSFGAETADLALLNEIASVLEACLLYTSHPIVLIARFALICNNQEGNIPPS